MESDRVVELVRKHTLFTWTASGKVVPLHITRAEGVHIWTGEGEKLLDFGSAAFSVHIGYGHPRVRQAIKEAADGLIYCSPGCASQERAELGALLAEMFPGDLDRFFFTLGGSDANENAIKMVRQFTGRPIVMGRYRSYHGATHATMVLGGDPRRRHAPDLPGFMQVLDISSSIFSFGEGEARIDNYLAYLEEVICTEGPERIAALFVESVPGTNGVLVPPLGYLGRVAELLRRYDILLVCDEVMTGFGRTGKMFAFEHHGVAPDLVTCAKGLSSSYVPLGCVALSDRIARYFDDNVFWGGLTYNSHPLAMAIAHATLRVLIDEGMVENAATLGELVAERFESLRRHPAVVDTRSIGLFGAIELDPERFPRAIHAPDRAGSPASNQLRADLRARGLYGIVRYNNLFVAPPLCITEAQLSEGLDIIDAQLAQL